MAFRKNAEYALKVDNCVTELHWKVTMVTALFNTKNPMRKSVAFLAAKKRNIQD